MKKIIILIIFCLSLAPDIAAAESLAQKLSGRILLQVQSSGQAWYVNPADGLRYYLGRPADAFIIMKNLALGISEADFNILDADKNLAGRLKGRIILRVEAKGEAYYISSTDGRKYYLGRPTDAFNLMRRLALGITNTNLAKIPAAQPTPSKSAVTTAPAPSVVSSTGQNNVLSRAAEAVRNNNTAQAQSYFTSSLRKAIAYTVSALNTSSRLLLANILSDATLNSQTDTEKIYSTQAYFSLGGYNVPLRFYVKKQPDGEWLITNL